MRTAAVLALCALAGCVSKSKYTALQGQLDQTRQQLTGQVQSRDKTIAGLKQDIAAREKKIAALTAQVKELEGRVAELKRQGAAKDGEIKRLQSELANVVKARAKLRASARELRRALAELAQRKAAAEARVAQFKRLLDRFRTLIDAGRLKVKIARGRMVLALPTDVLFPSGSATLSKEGIESVIQVTAVLAGIADREFQVEGHTDNVPIRSRRFPSNWELSAARAVNVARAMVDAGMPGSRLSAAGFAEFRPVAANDTPEGRAANRRIEIVLLPDLSKLPGFEELKKAVSGS